MNKNVADIAKTLRDKRRANCLKKFATDEPAVDALCSMCGRPAGEHAVPDFTCCLRIHPIGEVLPRDQDQQRRDDKS